MQPHHALLVQRNAIAELLTDNPSLRPAVPSLIAAQLPIARQSALFAPPDNGETATIDVTTLSFGSEVMVG
jgi:hypothetical protein